MNPGIHFLILTTIAFAIFALVMAYGWVGSVDRRLKDLEATQRRVQEGEDG